MVPTITAVELLSDNKIRVVWDPNSIPEKGWGGPPEGFTISWVVHNCIARVERNLGMTGSYVTDTLLRGNSNYEIKLGGRTSAGVGLRATRHKTTHPTRK